MKNGEEAHKQCPEAFLALGFAPWLTSQIFYRNAKLKPLGCLFKLSAVTKRIVPRSFKVVAYSILLSMGLENIIVKGDDVSGLLDWVYLSNQSAASLHATGLFSNCACV